MRGLATDALVDSYEAERGPVGRRNVAMSMVPGEGGGTADGLLEDLGAVVRSAVIVDDGSSEPAPAAGVGGSYVPDARPGARAPHAWLSIGEERVSTLDLFGRELVLLVAGDGGAWRTAAASVTESSARLRRAGPERRPLAARHRRDVRARPTASPTAARCWSGPTAWSRGAAGLRRPTSAAALAAAVAVATGRGSDADRDVLGSVASAAAAGEEAA